MLVGCLDAELCAVPLAGLREAELRVMLATPGEAAGVLEGVGGTCLAVVPAEEGPVGHTPGELACRCITVLTVASGKVVLGGVLLVMVVVR